MMKPQKIYSPADCYNLLKMEKEFTYERNDELEINVFDLVINKFSPQKPLSAEQIENVVKSIYKIKRAIKNKREELGI